MSVSRAFRFTCDSCGRETRWNWVDQDLRTARKNLAEAHTWSYKRLKSGGYVDLCPHCRNTII